MIRDRRGLSLIELIFALGLGMIVLGVGYRMYAAAVRADQFDTRRHRIVLASQNLIARIKQDVRSADGAWAHGSSLVLNPSDWRIDYESERDGSGVRRGTHHGWSRYPNLRADFRNEGQGIRVRVWSDAKVNRRPVKIDVTTFVRPRR